MKYTKCPICDERLRNGICPVCGYDFKRLEKKADLGGRHWDVLKRDTRTKKPSFVHDEKKCGRSKKSQTKKVSSWKNNGRTRNRNRAMSKQKANTSHNPNQGKAFQERKVFIERFDRGVKCMDGTGRKRLRKNVRLRVGSLGPSGRNGSGRTLHSCIPL